MCKKEKFVIIDGNSLASRAFYALPLLKNSQGQYTNAVYGFTTMLLRLLEEENPDYMAVAFDKSAPTFRHETYKEYKAQRMKSPSEYREQIPMIKEVLNVFSISYFEKEGYEADDLIGTYSRIAEEEKVMTLVITGDADIYQLISPYTKVLMTRKGITNIEIVDEEVLKEKYSLSPEQVVDFKALKGDPSDNIPGIPGIGEKTALKLLKKYGSLKEMLENSAGIKEVKLRKKIEQYREQSLLSQKLATIITDVRDGFELQACKMNLGNIDYSKARELFRSLEFKSLLDRLPGPVQENGREFTKYDSSRFKTAAAEKELTCVAQTLSEAEQIVVMLESISSNPFNSQTFGLTVGSDRDNMFYLPLVGSRGKTAVNKKEVFSVLKPYLEDEKIKKICPDSKFVINCLELEGISLKGLYFDPFIAVYLLAPGKPVQSLRELYDEFMNYNLPSREEILGKGVKAKKLDEVDINEMKNLSCAEGALLFELTQILETALEEKGLSDLFFQLELPLVKVLSAMELEGIKVDKDKLADMSLAVKGKIKSIKDQIYKLAGQEFNINSPKQLAFILFEKLNLPVIKKIKTGYSTSAAVLEELTDHHEIAKQILYYRQLKKLHGTYLEGLLGLVNENTGKIHTTFKQNITATGRLSSTDPNLQNIPVRLEEARKIRKVFIPEDPEGFLLSADYSQIELRVLAHISGDEQLINSFLSDEDIHLRTAAEIFGLTLDKVTSKMRDSAKVVNFGIIYGMSDYGLSQNLGISRKEARMYIKNYFEKYPGVKNYADKIIYQAGKKGYVTTLLNRRRYLANINHRNRNIRSFAERTAINTPIQGSAADLIKLAMLHIYNELQERQLKTKMLLQVHDELIFEVPSEEVTAVGSLVKDKMENIYKLKIPLKVDLKIGRNWHDMDKSVF